MLCLTLPGGIDWRRESQPCLLYSSILFWSARLLACQLMMAEMESKMSKTRASLCLMIAVCLPMVLMTTACASTAHYKGRNQYSAPKAASPMNVDGVADEAVW